MANNKEKIVTEVIVDATKAQVEIAKLNGVASDSTKDLEERIQAKNKAVKLQEELSKKTIKSLKDEIKTLEAEGASTKKLETAKKKLDRELIKQAKQAAANEKAMNKLADSEEETGLASLDLVKKLKAFVASPIGMAITALAAAFAFVSDAIGKNEKASNALSQVTAGLSAIFDEVSTAVSEALTPAIQFLADNMNKVQAVVNLIKAAFKAWISYFGLLISAVKAASQAMSGDFDEAQKTMNEGIAKFEKSVVEVKNVAVKSYETIANSADKTSKSIEGVATKAVKLKKRFQDLVKQRRALAIADSEANIQINELLRKSRDFTLSDKERLEAAKKAGELTAKGFEKRIALANKEIAVMKAQQALSATSAEEAQALNDKIVERNQLISDSKDAAKSSQDEIKGIQEEGIGNLQRRIEIEAQALDAQANDARRRGEDETQFVLDSMQKRMEAELEQYNLSEAEKDAIKRRYADETAQYLFDKKLEDADRDFEAQASIDETELSMMQRKGERTLALELKLLHDQMKNELKVVGLTEKEKFAIKKKYAEAENALKETTAKAERTRTNNQLKDGVSALGELFGFEKEAALARTLIGARESVVGAYKQASQGYVPPLSIAMGALGAAGALVPIVQSIRDITSTRLSIGGKSSGGGGSSTPAPTPPAPASVPSTIGIEDLGGLNALRIGEDQSVIDNANTQASANVQASTQANVLFSEDRYSDFRRQVKFKEDKSTF